MSDVQQLQRKGYRVREIAAMMGISSRSVWRLISEGKLQAKKLTSRTTIVEPEALEAFRESLASR